MTAPMDRAGVVRLLRDAGWSDCADYGFCDSDGYGCPCESIATRILAALEAAGLRVVPAVETRAMFEAGRDQMTTPAIWRAMVAASPFAPKQETQG